MSMSSKIDLLKIERACIRDGANKLVWEKSLEAYLDILNDLLQEIAEKIEDLEAYLEND